MLFPCALSDRPLYSIKQFIKSKSTRGEPHAQACSGRHFRHNAFVLQPGPGFCRGDRQDRPHRPAERARCAGRRKLRPSSGSRCGLDQLQGRHPVRDRGPGQQIQPAGKRPHAQGSRRPGHPLRDAGRGVEQRPCPERSREQAQREESGQIHSVLQFRGSGPGPDQREMQFLAFPLRRQRRHETGGDDQLHRQPQGHQEGLFDEPGLRLRPSNQQGGTGNAGEEAPRHRDRRRRPASAGQDQGFFTVHRQGEGFRRAGSHHRQLGTGLHAADQIEQGFRPGRHVLHGQRAQRRRAEFDRPCNC